MSSIDLVEMSVVKNFFLETKTVTVTDVATGINTVTDTVIVIVNSNDINTSVLMNNSIYKSIMKKLIEDIEKTSKEPESTTATVIIDDKICDILSIFVDSLDPNNFHKLNQIMNDLTSFTSSTLIDYIIAAIGITSSIFKKLSGKINAQMKSVIKEMKERKQLKLLQELKYFSSSPSSPFDKINNNIIKFIKIFNILLVTLNNIKNIDNKMFKKLISDEYIFNILIHYIIVIEHYPSNALFHALKPMIDTILVNLFYKNEREIMKIKDIPLEFNVKFTELGLIYTKKPIDICNMIVHLEYLFKQSNENSEKLGLDYRINMINLYDLLINWDANYEIIKQDIEDFITAIRFSEKDNINEQIAELQDNLLLLNNKFKQSPLPNFHIQLLCIYIKFILYRNIFQTESQTDINEMTQQLDLPIDEINKQIEFIENYIDLCYKDQKFIISHEVDKAYTEQFEKDKLLNPRVLENQRVLENVSKLSALSSRALSLDEGASSSLSSSALSLDEGASSSLSSSALSSRALSSSASSLRALSSSASSLRALSSSASSSLSSSALSSSALSFGELSLGESSASSLSLDKKYTISQQFIDFPFNRPINNITESLPFIMVNQYETCMKIESFEKMILFKVSSSPRTHLVIPSNIGIHQGSMSCYFNSLYQLLFCIEEFKNYVSSDSFITDQNNSFDSQKLTHKHNIFTKPKNNFSRFINYIKNIFSKNMSDNENPIWCETFIGVGKLPFDRKQSPIDEALDQLIQILKYNDNQELFELFEYTMEAQTFIYDLDGNIIECKSIKNPDTPALEKDAHPILQIPITELSTDLVTLLNEFCGLIPVTDNLLIDPTLGEEAKLRTINEHNILSQIFLGDNNNKIIPYIKKYYIARPTFNKYIIIHFKRLVNEVTKMNTKITINKKMLISDNLYILVGAIIHDGGAIGGHYVFHFYHSNNKITIYNEMSVQTRDNTPHDDEVLHTNGVMFLYIKLDGQPGGGIKSKLNKTFDEVHSTSSKPYFVRGTMCSPDNETSSFFPKKKDELTLESKWKNKYLKYKQKYLKLANKL